MATDEQKVRIVSDGLPTGTTVYVDGKQLNNVIGVTWTCSWDKPGTATLVLDLVEVELVGALADG